MIDPTWHLFPCVPNAKTPAVERGFHAASNDPERLRRWHAQMPSCNWGIACGPSGLVVIDIDPRSLPDGTDARALLDELPRTYTVRTASGGFHAYFRGRTRCRTRFQPGVDVKSDGGYVIAPGSTVDGVRYEVERALDVVDLPEWLEAAIGESGARAAAGPVQTDCPPHLTRDDRWLPNARANLRHLPGSPKGSGGTPLFTAAAIMMRGWLLPRATAEALLLAEYNPRCAPPWDFAKPDDASNWEHTLNRAETQSDIEWGSFRPLVGLGVHAEHPDDLAKPVPLPATAAEWTLLEGSLVGATQTVERSLRAYRNQVLKRIDPGQTPELQNSTAVIRWLTEAKGWSPTRIGAELGPEAAHYALTLKRDAEVQVVGRLTRIDQLLAKHDLRWNEMALAIEIDGRPWTDNDTANARIALEQSGASDPEKPMPNGDIEQRARALAKEYHPVAEYLAELPPWDGVPRVDGLWVRYFGAEDCDLNRKLGACFALGAVRRVLEPGCKLDMMPILYGSQGEFKSSGLSALVGDAPFFTDAAPGFGHRSENAMTLTGCWVWEIAEMQGMDRADQNAVKAFVTRREDDVLLPYARAKARLKRRSVTIGTTNDEACLNDPTGSRRHPVIAIGTVDRDGLARDRDAFWAEALYRVRAGEPHWLSREDERKMSERNADNHTRVDEEMTLALEAWFELPEEQRFRTEYERRFPPQGKPYTSGTFTVRDVIQFALGGKSNDRTAVRVGRALKAMGVKMKRTGKKRIFTYWFPLQGPAR